jgi:hypothetical protein
MEYKFDVLEYVARYVNKQNALYNHTYKVYDPPVWEYLVKSESGIPEMVFIYFTVCDGIEGERYKRYYQLVTGCFGIELYYEDQNVIDISKNYPLSDVRLKFTNWCKHMLSKLN